MNLNRIDYLRANLILELGGLFQETVQELTSLLLLERVMLFHSRCASHVLVQIASQHSEAIAIASHSQGILESTPATREICQSDPE